MMQASQLVKQGSEYKGLEDGAALSTQGSKESSLVEFCEAIECKARTGQVASCSHMIKGLKT